MNKQCRYGRNNKKEYVETKLLYMKGKKVKNTDKMRFDLSMNRSCFFSPETKDAAQITDFVEIHKENKSSRIASRKVQSVRKSQVDVQSMCKIGKDVLSPRCVASRVPQGSVRSVRVPDSRDDIDVAVVKRTVKYKEDTVQTGEVSNVLSIHPRDINISNEPRVKVIAERFARYKNNNVEVRKLEARIACMEYDVFQLGKEDGKPIQTLRAYFSVTPVHEAEKEKLNNSSATALDGAVAHDFADGDKGIEIIDANILENKSILEGLKHVLKSKQLYKVKRTNVLDSMYLYQMALRVASANAYSYTDFLSKAELEEIKDLIIKKTTSSAHGISRRKLRAGDETKSDNGVKDDIINELFRFM